MNIHPLFVHFPIALLLTYGAIELARFNIVKKQPAWFSIKAVLVILGSISAVAARQTGELLEEQLEGSGGLAQIVQMHSLWATISTGVFGIIAACYVVAWVNSTECVRCFENKPQLKKLWAVAVAIQKIILQTPLIIVALVLCGMAAITITGALGGAMVYGPSVDPVVQFIYSVFIGK